MNLYDGAKARVRVGSAYSKKFEVRVVVCNICECCYRKTENGCDQRSTIYR